MHPNEKAVNDFVKVELRHQVKVLLDDYEKRRRKLYIAILIMLTIMTAAMFYIGLTFHKWNTRWENKAQKDKEAMEQYYKDRNEWKGTDNDGTSGKK